MPGATGGAHSGPAVGWARGGGASIMDAYTHRRCAGGSFRSASVVWFAFCARARRAAARRGGKEYIPSSCYMCASLPSSSRPHGEALHVTVREASRRAAICLDGSSGGASATPAAIVVVGAAAAAAITMRNRESEHTHSERERKTENERKNEQEEREQAQAAAAAQPARQTDRQPAIQSNQPNQPTRDGASLIIQTKLDEMR